MPYNRVFGTDGMLQYVRKSSGSSPPEQSGAVGLTKRRAKVKPEHSMQQALETMFGAMPIFFINLHDWTFATRPQWMRQEDFEKGQHAGWNPNLQYFALDMAVSTQRFFGERFAGCLNEIRTSMAQHIWHNLNQSADEFALQLLRQLGPVAGAKESARLFYILNSGFPAVNVSAPACVARQLFSLLGEDQRVKLLLLGESMVFPGHLMVLRW